MEKQISNRQTEQVSKRRDIPHFIKWILLIILLILLFMELFSGEYKRLYDLSSWIVWLVIFIKLILIFGILILMRVQRSLKCEITDPTGCTEETPDPVAGILFVKVRGTASGGVFSHYTIDIQKDGDPVVPGIVSYPGGGAAGVVPVVAGELATINTTGLSDGAYTITLTVHPVGSGSVSICTRTFNLLKVAVWINSVDGVVPTPNIFNEDAELRDPGGELSFGGSLQLLGSAYIYECADRKVQRVEMRYATIPFGGPIPLQPATNAAVPAAWAPGNQVGTALVYDPTKYWSWTRIGMAPTYLLNTWGTCTIGLTTYPVLSAQNWNSRTASGPGEGGDYYKLLLMTEDTAGNFYFDTQKVWVDNHTVRAQLVKFQRFDNGVWVDIPNCTDVLLSWKKLRLIGIAWDNLINPAYPPVRPNDNFSGYSLNYAKQFVGGSVAIPVLTPGIRVPSPADFPLTGAVPAVADAKILAEWDLSTLDGGASPTPGTCPSPAGNPHGLHRGCECTYIITLNVSDFTIGSEPGVHSTYDLEAVKIINDLK